MTSETSPCAPPTDLHERITTGIFAGLETGMTPCTKPCATFGVGSVSRPLRHTVKHIRTNVMLL
jgi:antirestriction protein ArdC